MCGRYVRRSDKQRIAEAFRVAEGLAELVLGPDDFNVAPTTFQPVIRETREGDAREILLMRWGLVPFFTKQLADVKGVSTINARAESVAKGSMWREPFKKRRCLVPADAFYEWKRVDAPGKRQTREPFAFTVGGGPFAFAGLWDAWKDPQGNWLQSYTIITTEANEAMAPVHTRMPVILHPRDYSRWLSREVTEQPPLDLLRPFPADEMERRPANPLVGNVKNNGPEMLNSA